LLLSKLGEDLKKTCLYISQNNSNIGLEQMYNNILRMMVNNEYGVPQIQFQPPRQLSLEDQVTNLSVEDRRQLVNMLQLSLPPTPPNPEN
jgi:hypothetical protein